MSALYPETFREICESVLEEADGRAVQLSSVSLGRDPDGDLYVTEPTHRNVISWVAKEYERIQRLSPSWAFLHKRGTIINVSSGSYSYTKSGIREIDRDSIYFVKNSGSARYPMQMQSYDWWQEQQRVGDTSTASAPTYLVKGPGEEWIVWPIPSAVGTVRGDYTVETYQLIEAGDEPCWDPQFNDLLKWGAILKYAAEFAGEGSADKLIIRARMSLPGLMSAFERKYLPPTCGPCSLF